MWGKQGQTLFKHKKLKQVCVKFLIFLRKMDENPVKIQGQRPISHTKIVSVPIYSYLFVPIYYTAYTAKQNRLRYYHSQKGQVSDYGLIEDSVCNKVLCQNMGRENKKNGQVAKSGSLEPFKEMGDFRDNSSGVLCRNR